MFGIGRPTCQITLPPTHTLPTAQFFNSQAWPCLMYLRHLHTFVKNWVMLFQMHDFFKTVARR